jgi:hypothetical protein
MTVGIVVGLEVVDIGQKKCNTLPILNAMLAVEAGRELRIEVSSVEEPGERIDVSEALQFLFVRFPTLSLSHGRVNVRYRKRKQGLSIRLVFELRGYEASNPKERAITAPNLVDDGRFSNMRACVRNGPSDRRLVRLLN